MNEIIKKKSERMIQVLLSNYIARIIKDKVCKDEHDINQNIELISMEFPIPKDFNIKNDSEMEKNVDFLLLSETCVYFVELKSNTSSWQDKQMKNYLKILDKINNGESSFKTLMGNIENKANNKFIDKYSNILNKLGTNSNINKAKVIYIVPEEIKKDKSKNNTKIEWLSFSDLAETEYDDSVYNIILGRLKELDNTVENRDFNYKDSNEEFVNMLLKQFIEAYKTPKVQAERIVEAILEPYIGRIIKQLVNNAVKNCSDKITKINSVHTEYSLRIVNENYNPKVVDFMIKYDNTHCILLELKTDSNYFDETQLAYYKSVANSILASGVKEYPYMNELNGIDDIKICYLLPAWKKKFINENDYINKHECYKNVLFFQYSDLMNVDIDDVFKDISTCLSYIDILDVHKGVQVEDIKNGIANKLVKDYIPALKKIYDNEKNIIYIKKDGKILDINSNDSQSKECISVKYVGLSNSINRRISAKVQENDCYFVFDNNKKLIVTRRYNDTAKYLEPKDKKNYLMPIIEWELLEKTFGRK